MLRIQSLRTLHLVRAPETQEQSLSRRTIWRRWDLPGLGLRAGAAQLAQVGASTPQFLLDAHRVTIAHGQGWP